MNILWNYLQKMSKRSLIFLIGFAFFHILISMYAPEIFSGFYKLEAWKDAITFSFRFWQIFRNFLMWIPLIWWILMGIYLLKLMRTEWFKTKSKWLILFLLLCVFWPFIGYFMIKFNWWFNEVQKEYIKQFVIFWCYVVWINVSRQIGAVMSDLVIVYSAIGQWIAKTL
jgi:hypothetical protein